jgi:hypothetical protein
VIVECGHSHVAQLAKLGVDLLHQFVVARARRIKPLQPLSHVPDVTPSKICLERSETPAELALAIMSFLLGDDRIDTDLRLGDVGLGGGLVEVVAVRSRSRDFPAPASAFLGLAELGTGLIQLRAQIRASHFFAH